MTYLKEYQTEPQYQEDKPTLILPNVSLVAEENDVHYNHLIAVTGVTLNKSALELERGGSETLIATVLPSEASRKDVIWSTSDSGIATVDSDGLVTAVAAGNVTITVTTVDGGYSAQCATSVQLPLDEQYMTFVALESGTFKFSSSTETNTLDYSTNGGGTWTTLTNNTSTPTIAVGSKVLWRCTNTGMTISSYKGIGQFVSTAKFNVYGNIMSLHYKDSFTGQTSLSGKDYAFANLFNSCTGITDASNLVLPATTLANYCYGNMFWNCTSLTTAPVLPATTLATQCYQYMFLDCTGLTTAPSLPATTLANSCYSYMFSNCTSLTTAPSLPATTLAVDCYRNMFKGCTKLNSITCFATNISASDCTTNWVKGVAATGTFTKADYMTGWTPGNNGIPNGWTVRDNASQYLTFVAQESGTFKLSGNSVNYSVDNGKTWTTLASDTDSPTVQAGSKIMFKAELTPKSYGGIGTFSSTGSFIAQGNVMSLLYGDNFRGQTSLSGKNFVFSGLFLGTGLTSAENMSLPATTLANYCYNGMFSDCTSLTTAPELPATTLADNCYQNMFFNCTSLTTAPSILPATTMANSCYYCMFQDCTSLTTAPELPAKTLAYECYCSMFSGCKSLTTAPVLSATTLAYYCYNGMFYGCESLTTAPVLPATILADYCYNEMFYGCTNLNSITCLATDISATDCTDNWVDGVAATGTFTKAASMSSWKTGPSGIPTRWTVVNA